MPSDFKKRLTIRWKRFKRWVHSDDFMTLVMRIIAIGIIVILIGSGFVVMLNN